MVRKVSSGFAKKLTTNEQKDETLLGCRARCSRGAQLRQARNAFLEGQHVSKPDCLCRNTKVTVHIDAAKRAIRDLLDVSFRAAARRGGETWFEDGFGKGWRLERLLSLGAWTVAWS